MFGTRDSRHFLALILLGFCVVGGGLIPIAVDDIRMVDVYSVDEAGAAAEVRYLLGEGLSAGLSNKYGSLFYYIPYALLAPFDDLTDRTILIGLRAFSLIGALACLWLTWVLGRSVFDGQVGVVAAALLAVSSVFVRWGITIHPDLPQLFWMLLSLVFVIRLSRGYASRDVIYATMCAAMAFNTKFGGVFLLPVIVAGVLTAKLDEEARWNSDRLLGLLFVPVIFVGAVALTNPLAVLDFQAFSQSLEAERQIMGFGHSVRVERSLGDWMAILYVILGPVNTLVVIAAGGVSVWHLMKRRAIPRKDVALMVLWVVVLVAYLSLFSSLKRARHLLPILPVVLLFVGYAYVHAWRLLEGRPVRWAVVAVALIGAWGPASDSSALAGATLDRRTPSNEIEAGRWIGSHYPPSMRVLYSTYAYVPSEFRDAFRLFEMSYPIVNHFRPDLLVVREAMAAEYSDTSRAASSRTGRGAFMDAHYFHRYLKTRQIDDYRLLRSFGAVDVYARQEGIAPRRGTWLSLVEEYATGKLRGAKGARHRVAAWLLADGDSTAARAQRTRGLGAEVRSIRHYRDAVKYLKEGRLPEAKDHFEEVVRLSMAESDSFQTLVRQRIARSYFEHRFFEEAQLEAGRALAANDALRSLQFEYGVFLLASGRETAADSVFGRAIDRFGRSAQGRSLLRQLVSQNIAREGAQRLLRAHYTGGGQE